MGTRGQEWGSSTTADLNAILMGPRLSREQVRARFEGAPILAAIRDGESQALDAMMAFDDGERVTAAPWVERLSDASLTRRLRESAERMRQWDDGGPVQLDWIGSDAGKGEETMLQLMSEARRRLWG